MNTKLTKLSKWLYKNNYIDEALSAASLSSKLASNCEGPFDRQISSDIKNGTISLSAGSRGPAVGYIQTLLMEAGYSLPNFGADCVFGPETESALRKFKLDNNLPPPHGVITGMHLYFLEKSAPIAAVASSGEAIGEDSSGVVPRRSDVPESELGPPDAKEGRFTSSNGDIIFPLKPNSSTHLVVFYHGITGQEPILEQMGSVSSNVTFLIPKGSARSYEEVKATIEEVSNNHGIEITGKSLGGWSAGSSGFANAAGKDQFEKLMLADPSPNTAIMQNPPSGVYMEYNPNNWTGQYANLGQILPELARKIEANGGESVLTTDGHDPILKSILDKLK